MTSDYRRGVEDALNKTEALWNSYSKPTPLGEVFKDVKKSLLTKNVTMWFNVYSDGKLADVGQRALYGSKDGAFSFRQSSVNGLPYFGPVSIEIEVPID